jgi:formylglycine-generating enzyme required for sulfatase activity
MGKTGEPWDVLPGHDANHPRLVVLSPFLLGTTEVTVAEYRGAGGRFAANAWSGRSEGNSFLDFCTYTRAPGPRDAFPINCVTWENARRWCAERDALLPTEAQYEYAAGGSLGRTYPWGEDQPICSDAVFARVGWGLFQDSLATCRPPEPPGGSLPPGSGARDRVFMPTGTLLDLAGNVAEWSLDSWNRSEEPCWNTRGVLYDPLCIEPESLDGLSLRAVRGGDWLVSSGQLSRSARKFAPGSPLFVSPKVSFRCARPAGP